MPVVIKYKQKRHFKEAIVERKRQEIVAKKRIILPVSNTKAKKTVSIARRFV